MRDTLYVDQPQARFAIQARDVSGRPVAVGTIASLTFNGANLIDATTSCGLDSYGRCIVVWDAPSAAFDFGGPVAVQVTAQAQSASFSAFSQSGLVQMSLAWADTDQGRPRMIAA